MGEILFPFTTSPACCDSAAGVLMGISARWQVIRQWRDVISLGWWQMTTELLCALPCVFGLLTIVAAIGFVKWVFSTSEAERFAAADSRNKKP